MKDCFIITPIGGSSSDTRRETDGLTKSVLTPVLEAHGFKPIPAHEITETGSISRQMMQHLLQDELVIANLTSLNPNVMYEVGVRHCSRKPLIVIARTGTKLPFDLNDERTVFYENDIAGTEELKDQLEAMIPSAIKDSKPDNPVYRVVEVDLIQLPEGTPDAMVLADKRFSLIEKQLDDIQLAIRHSSVGLPIPRKVGTGLQIGRVKITFSIDPSEQGQADSLIDFIENNHSLIGDLILSTPNEGEIDQIIFDSDNISSLALVEEFSGRLGLRSVIEFE